MTCNKNNPEEKTAADMRRGLASKLAEVQADVEALKAVLARSLPFDDPSIEDYESEALEADGMDPDELIKAVVEKAFGESKIVRVNRIWGVYGGHSSEEAVGAAIVRVRSDSLDIRHEPDWVDSVLNVEVLQWEKLGNSSLRSCWIDGPSVKVEEPGVTQELIESLQKSAAAFGLSLCEDKSEGKGRSFAPVLSGLDVEILIDVFAKAWKMQQQEQK